jgi:hypothetical protein
MLLVHRALHFAVFVRKVSIVALRIVVLLMFVVFLNIISNEAVARVSVLDVV